METPKELVFKRTNLNPEIGMGKVMVQLMNEYVSLINEAKDLSSQSIKGAEAIEKNINNIPKSITEKIDRLVKTKRPIKSLLYIDEFRKLESGLDYELLTFGRACEIITQLVIDRYLQEFAQQHTPISDEKLYAELKKDLEESDRRSLGHYKPEEIVGESIDDKYASFGLRNRNIPSDEAIEKAAVQIVEFLDHSHLSLKNQEEWVVDIIKGLTFKSQLKSIDVKKDTKIQDLLLDMTNKEKSKFLKWIAKQEFKSE